MTKQVVDKIEKTKIDKWIDQSMTLKEYFLFEKEIDKRINYISDYIANVLGYTINYVILSNGYREDFGRFDPRLYHKFVGLKTYTTQDRDNYAFIYMDGFPTRFLYEDFEQEVEADFKQYMLDNPNYFFFLN